MCEGEKVLKGKLGRGEEMLLLGTQILKSGITVS